MMFEGSTSYSDSISTDGTPSGWINCLLGDVLTEIRNGTTVHQTKDGIGVPISRIETIYNSDINLDRVGYVLDPPERIRTRFCLRVDDILFSHINSSTHLGKTAIVSKRHLPLLHGMNLLLLRPDAGALDPSFLHFWCTHARYAGVFAGVAQHAVNQASINQVKLKAIPLSLPGLVEQRAIVAKVQALFSELDKGVEQLQTIKQQLKQYRQAVLKAAFEGKLTAAWRAEQQAAGTLSSADELLEQIRKEREQRYRQQLCEWERALAEWRPAAQPDSELKKPRKPRRIIDVSAPTEEELGTMPSLPYGWVWAKVGQLFDVYVGSTPSRDRAEYWGGSIRWVSSGEVAFHDIFDTEEKITELGLESTSARVHPPGSVLMAMIGEGKTRGQSAILRVAASHNQNTAAIRVGETRYLPEFLSYFLQWTYDQNRGIGSGNNQKALNQARVQELIIPVCDPAEQRQVVSLLETYLSVVDDNERALCEGLERAEVLRQSILRRAFEGHLLSDAELAAVRNDPEYEPADRLLDRIRAEKSLGGQPSRSRRSRRESKPVRPSRPRRNAIDVRGDAR